MVKKQTFSKEQLNQIILRTIEKEKPETTEQLIKLVEEQTTLSREEITRLLIQMENEDMLHFTKKDLPPASTFQAYLSSRKAVWFWVTVSLALATVVVVLIIPENAFPEVYLRYAMTIVSVLFLPGYAIIRALYPFEIPVKTGDGFTDNLERVTLSLAVSIAIVPIVAVLLNFTPWGIRIAPVLSQCWL
jgi:hypothetical protein